MSMVVTDESTEQNRGRKGGGGATATAYDNYASLRGCPQLSWVQAVVFLGLRV